MVSAPLLWAGLLLLLGLILVLVEIFIPSGGILGVLSFTAILSAIVMAFYRGGVTSGLVFMLAALLAVPTIVGLAFRWLPGTPMGKRLLADLPTSEEVLPDNAQLRSLRDLVGKTGRARSMMLPSGAVEIDGRTIDAVSEGLPIDPGQAVRVIEVRGTRVVVRPVSETAPTQAAADDLLSQPFEKLGLDPFDDPLA